MSSRPTRWVLVTILIIASAFILVALGVLITSYRTPAFLGELPRLGILAVVPLMLFAFLNLARHPLGHVRLSTSGAPSPSTPAEGLLLLLAFVAVGFLTLEKYLLGRPVDPWRTQARILAAFAFFPSVLLAMRAVRLLRSTRARATEAGGSGG